MQESPSVETPKYEAPATVPVERQVAEMVSYHKPTDEQVNQISEIRAATEKMLLAILKNCPQGPDRSAAIRKAREAMMTANASIVVPWQSW
jgi:hypothetical protein